MSNIELKLFRDISELGRDAASLFCTLACESIATRGRFVVALSGGSTPLVLYTLLATPEYSARADWSKAHFFWGDERCVPPDHAESSYAQAYAAWLGRLEVPATNIHRARGELGPGAAAEDYSRQLKVFADSGLDWPRFDLVLLGLGTDGHTASLFPGSPLEYNEPCIPVTASYQGRPAQRVTLTPPVINSARNVAFLLTGEEKAAVFYETVFGAKDPVHLPAQRITPLDGKTWWLADQTAGRDIQENKEI